MSLCPVHNGEDNQLAVEETLIDMCTECFPEKKNELETKENT